MIMRLSYTNSSGQSIKPLLNSHIITSYQTLGDKLNINFSKTTEQEKLFTWSLNIPFTSITNYTDVMQFLTEHCSSGDVGLTLSAALPAHRGSNPPQEEGGGRARLQKPEKKDTNFKLDL